MRKSISLAFILSLIFFLILNFLFYIIGNAIEGSLETEFNYISNNPLYILYRLNQPMAHFPWDIAEWINDSGFSDGDRLRFGLMIVAIVGAAIIAGLTGGSIKNALIGWVITCIVSIVMLYIAVYYVEIIYHLIWGSYGASFNEVALKLFITGIFNTALYGLLVALVALIAGKSKSYK